MNTKSKTVQTRGRPKKEEHRNLDPKYKKLFPENAAVCSACCLMYVFQVFVPTKTQKRVGHKDGGFTMFEKISAQYSFESFEDDLGNWECSELLEQEHMKSFLFQLPSLGPKLILREIVNFTKFIIEKKSNEESEKEIEDKLMDEKIADEYFPNMRFSSSVLKQLKIQNKNQKEEKGAFFEMIHKRVSNLWKPFVQIMVYTSVNAMNGEVHNKYYKPFFSDAENPQQTYIGQRDLCEIVSYVKRMENQHKQRQSENHQTEVRHTFRQQPILVITNPSPFQLKTEGPTDIVEENGVKKEIEEVSKIKNEDEKNQNQNERIYYKKTQKPTLDDDEEEESENGKRKRKDRIEQYDVQKQIKEGENMLKKFQEPTKDKLRDSELEKQES